jgi:ankyrin repeat protein
MIRKKGTWVLLASAALLIAGVVLLTRQETIAKVANRVVQGMRYRVSPATEQLFQMSRDGDVAGVKALLAQGVDPNAINPVAHKQMTAIMYAARGGHTEIVLALLSAGANPDSQTDAGSTALMMAAYEGHAGAVRALLANGANPDLSAKTDITALTIAINKGHINVVRLLATAGRGVNQRSLQGSTPLMYASERGVIGAIQILLDAGADPNATDVHGRTALKRADEKGQAEAVRELRARGVKS